MHMVHAATEVGAWSREEREAKICGTPCAPDGRGAVVLAFANESGDANIAAGCVCGVCVSKTHQSATLRAMLWACWSVEVPSPASGAPARARPRAPPSPPGGAAPAGPRAVDNHSRARGTSNCLLHVARPVYI